MNVIPGEIRREIGFERESQFLPLFLHRDNPDFATIHRTSVGKRIVRARQLSYHEKRQDREERESGRD
jgi:hypothetical protein